MTAWYILRSATNRECKARDGLTEQGFSAFLPMERVMRRMGKFQQPIERPLFPGYLFVLAEPANFRQIRETQGVQQFVTYVSYGEAEPVVIPLEAIIEMQTDEVAGRYDRNHAKPNVYRPKKGDKIKVTAGPWVTFIGKVLDTPRGQRAKVMIEGPYGRGIDLDVSHMRAA